MPTAQVLKRKEGGLFFKSWLNSPRAVGSVWPSSQALARAVARNAVYEPGDTVVELGGGTGAITQGLIDRGIPREAIMVIELDPELVRFLEDRLPNCQIVRGDATRLSEILAQRGVERVGTVVSGLPMVGNPKSFRCAIVQQMLRTVRPSGAMLQYGYSPVPVVPLKELGITAEMAAYVGWNLPPAAVWRYRPA